MKTNNFLLIVILLGGFGLFFGSLAKYEQKNKIKISSMEDTKAIAKFNDIQKNKNIDQNFTQPASTPQQSVVPHQSVVPNQPEEKKISLIKVHLPTNASVFINNKATYSSGPYRIYDVELAVGKPYKFKVVVSYASGISVAKDIVLSGGEEVVLNFAE